MEDENISSERLIQDSEKQEDEEIQKYDNTVIQDIYPLWINYFRNTKLIKIFRKFLYILISVSIPLFLIVFLIYIIPVIQEMTISKRSEIKNNREFKVDPAYKKQSALISRDIQQLSRKYNAYSSGQSYIVINTTDNRFSLYRNKKLVREGFCSSGSYTLLQSQGEKKWIFRTPKGKFIIQDKTTSPVWKKPDWAFVELGLPVPPPDDQSRFEYGVLGDYALILQEGYMIHGTIYKRFLGMPVTHGCIRLNDDDLEAIFNTLNIGSKVYIF